MTTARIGAGFAAYWAVFAALSLSLANFGWVVTMIGLGAVALVGGGAAQWWCGLLSPRTSSGRRARPRTVSAPPTAG